MQGSEVPRAVAAAKSTASSLDLTIDDAILLQDSNKLTLRLLPCDVLARVTPVAHQVAQFELEVAQRLAESGCPVAALEPRVEPRVYERDGFVVTLWTYYEPVTPREVSPADCATALERLHAGMRELDVATPHFTDRVDQAQQLVASRDDTPALVDADRELLGDTLRGLRRGSPAFEISLGAAPGRCPTHQGRTRSTFPCGTASCAGSRSPYGHRPCSGVIEQSPRPGSGETTR
jgi:hypothetical protein